MVERSENAGKARQGERNVLAQERAIQPPQSTFVSVMTPVNNLNLKVESPALVAEIDLDARTVRIFKSADSETLRALLAILREPIK